MLDEYAQHLRGMGLAPATVNHNRSFVGQLLREVDPRTVDAAALDEWLNSAGWSTRTMETARGAARRFLGWYVTQGGRGDNPLERSAARTAATHDRGALVVGFVDYLGRRRLSPETLRLRRSVVARLLLDVDAHTVTEYELDEWVHSQGWADASVNVAVASLRRFFEWMQRSGRRADNPTMELRTVPVKQRAPRRATDSAIRAALLTAPVDVQAMILLGAECGLRRAEIASVRGSDIAGGWLTVIGKGSRQRRVHLSPRLLELLRELAPDGGYAFRRGDTHVTPERVYQLVLCYVGVNTHALRHRAATTVYGGTHNDLRVTQRFLGHSSPVTTARYVHVDESDLLAAAAAAQL